LLLLWSFFGTVAPMGYGYSCPPQQVPAVAVSVYAAPQASRLRGHRDAREPVVVPWRRDGGEPAKPEEAAATSTRQTRRRDREEEKEKVRKKRKR
jgi:hypothetical protein